MAVLLLVGHGGGFGIDQRLSQHGGDLTNAKVLSLSLVLVFVADAAINVVVVIIVNLPSIVDTNGFVRQEL